MIEWKHEDLNVENVNIVLVPKSEQNTQECLRAKLEEIEKLKKYETYKEVDDVGQFRISTTWVLWYKNGVVRARLVARGYEEITEIRTLLRFQKVPCVLSFQFAHL